MTEYLQWMHKCYLIYEHLPHTRQEVILLLLSSFADLIVKNPKGLEPWIRSLVEQFPELKPYYERYHLKEGDLIAHLVSLFDGFLHS
jgi:hypothetical protein